jgi:hypothetical protein
MPTYFRRLELFLWFLLLCLPLRAQFTTSGNAGAVGGQPGCWNLTQNSANQSGQIWSTANVDVNQYFDMLVEVRLSNNSNDAGADGMAFVLRPSSAPATGTGGGQMGFGGITPSLIVELDTYVNTGAPSFDPNSDHIGVQKNGSNAHVAPDMIAAPVSALNPVGNIETGNWYTLRVTYNPDTDNLKVFFNCVERISTTVDLAAILGTNLVRWGFTAGTGGLSNQHRVCDPVWVSGMGNYLPSSVTACAGAPSTFTIPAGITGVTWAPNTALSATTGNTVTASPTTTTTYTVTYNNLCNAPTTEQITVNVAALPTSTLPVAAVSCNGTPINLPNGPWPAGVVGTWAGGSTAAVLPVTQSGTYTLTVQDTVQGCSATYFTNVSAINLAPVNLGPDLTVCPGTAVVVDGSGGNLGVTVSWNGTAGLPTYELPGPGTYIAVATQGPCQVRDTLSLAWHPSYNVDLGGGPLDLCLGGTLELDAEDPAWTGAPVDFVWSNGAHNSTLTVDAAGLYTVEVTTDACSFNDGVQVVNSPNQGVNLGEDLVLCATATAVLSSGYPAANTAWNSVTSGGSAPAAGTYAVGGEDEVVAVEVTFGQCVTRDTLEVNHVPLFDPGLAASVDICLNDSVLLTAASGADAYTWTGGASGPTLWATAPGLYAVAAPISGCPHTDAVQVVPSANTGVDLGDDAVLCDGNTFTVASGYVAAATSWFVNGAAAGPAALWSVTGADATLVAEVTVGACVSRDTVVVDHVPYFDAGLPAALTVCEGDSVFIAAAPGAPVYTWNTGAVAQGIWATAGGTYSISTPIQGCPHVDATLLTVNPLPDFDLGLDLAFCEGESVLLSTGIFLSDATTWSSGASGPTYEVSSTGNVSVSVTVDGCTTSDAVDVTVHPLPVFTLGLDRTLCPDETAELSTGPMPSGSLVTWNTGAAGTSFDAGSTGVYVATAVRNGCSWTDDVTVEVADRLEADVPLELLVCEGDSILVSVENEPNLFPVSYLWSTDATTPAIRIGRQGSYNVTVSNACESVMAEFEVRLEPCGCVAWVPSAFTPDNDGRNDGFRPVLSCAPGFYNFRIFNAWGEQIFATSDPDGVWFGQIENDPTTSEHGGYFGANAIYRWTLELTFPESGDIRILTSEGTVMLAR